jgi:hypothetical protein
MDGPEARTGRRGFLAAAGGTTLAASGAVDTGRAKTTVDDELSDASGTIDVAVRLETADVPDREAGTASRQSVIDSLREHAAETQQRVERGLSGRSGVAVKGSLWLANAIIAEVDTDVIEIERLAELDGVVRIHRTGKEGRTTTRDRELAATINQQDDPDREYSYGLEMMNVPQVWDRYGVRGEGVRIAVIDTGVDPSHPDIDLAGWAEFDADGERVDSEPHDEIGHGTGMSSLATGGDAGGTHIGVAPDAELLAAKHDESDFMVSTTAAMEWAIENGADVISLSVEFGLYNADAIEPIENAASAGVAVVTTGVGLDLLSSPGNVPSSVIAGVVDEARQPYNDGTGGEIRTERYWRGAPVPSGWPERFTAPDVATAGVDVLGAVPESVSEELYTRANGYSNGPPHVAGVIALLQSAADDRLSVSELKQLLRETASQPGDDFARSDPNGQYGSGIVNAAHAVTAILEPDGEITGTVTDADGATLEGATVTFETGASTTTDADGTYALSGIGSGGVITVTAVGYESEKRTVAPGGDGDITLGTETGPDIARAERPPTHLESGESATLAFDIAHAEAANLVSLETAHQISGSELTLSINGEQAAFENAVTLSDDPSTLRVEIEADPGAVGRLSLGVGVGAEAADGEFRTSQIDVGEIHVHPTPFQIEEGEDLQRAVDIAAPDARLELAGGRFDVETAPFDREFPATRTSTFEPIFGPAMGDPVGLIVDKPLTIAAADGGPRIVAHSDTEDGIGVRVMANYVTLEGIEIDGDGIETAVNVLDGSGVHLDGLTVANAPTGVHSQFNASLAVRSCELTVSGTGIVLTDGTQNALLRDNAITGSQRGVFVDSERTPLDVSTELDDNRFENVETEVDSAGLVDIAGRDIGGSPGDSSLDLLLYAMTAGSLGLLFVPYALRRRR